MFDTQKRQLKVSLHQFTDLHLIEQTSIHITPFSDLQANGVHVYYTRHVHAPNTYGGRSITRMSPKLCCQFMSTKLCLCLMLAKLCLYLGQTCAFNNFSTPAKVRIELISNFCFYCLPLYYPNGICPMGKSGCLLQGKPAATESLYPTYGTCWLF